METTFTGKRNKRGDWRPDEALGYAPVLVWPPRPMAFLRWLFGYPGYFLPWGVIYMAFPVITWLWFTPPMSEMTTFRPGWIAYILVRNAILLALVLGSLAPAPPRAQGPGDRFQIRRQMDGAR